MDKFGEYWSYLIILIVLFPTLEAVFLRYMFRQPTIWSQELTTMIFGTWFMIGGAYCESRGAHVAMDLFYGNYRGVVKIIADTLIFLSCAVICLVLLRLGWSYWLNLFLTGERTDSVWKPLLWPSRIAIWIGPLLLLIRSFLTYVERLRGEVIRMKGGAEAK